MKGIARINATIPSHDGMIVRHARAVKWCAPRVDG